MRERRGCTPDSGGAPALKGEWVSIFVPDDHPVLRLKGALDWEAITAVMVKHWREAKKNVDEGRRVELALRNLKGGGVNVAQVGMEKARETDRRYTDGSTPQTHVCQCSYLRSSLALLGAGGLLP